MASNQQQRQQIEQRLAGEYAKSGRFGEIGGLEYQRTLREMYDQAGVASGDEQTARVTDRANDVRAIRKELDRYITDDLMGDIARRSWLGTETHQQLRRAAFEAAGVALPNDTFYVLEQRQKAKEQKEAERWLKNAQTADNKPAPDAADQFDAARSEAIRRVKNRYVSDPEMRAKYGSAQYKQDVLNELRANGVATEDDAHTYGPRQNTRNAFYKTAEWAGLFDGFGRAAHGGERVGAALGDVAEGLSRGLDSTAGGFVKVGEKMLSLILSPLGRTGAGAAGMAGALGNSLLAVLGGAGSIAASGVKIGGVLAGGIAAGLANVIPTAIGAGIGALIPGVGPLLGGAAGASLGGGLASLVGSLLGAVGGALGQTFAAIGQAIGAVGQSIATTLGNVQSVLSDLVQTGVAFATATNAIGRGGGLTTAGAAQYSALAQVLTGSPSGLNAFFSNIGTMAAYLPSRAAAFGVTGVHPNNPASLIAGAYNRWQSYGDGPRGAVQRQILLQGLFPGASDQFGNLFSAGGGAVGAALSAARQTALTPAEVQQNAKLGFDLGVVSAQLTRIKTQFLTDLMPAIQMGLHMATDFLSKDGGKITSTLESVGKWLVVKFPTYLQAGVDGLFNFGRAVLGLVPILTTTGQLVTTALAQMFNGIKAMLVGGLSMIPGVGPLLALPLARLPNLNSAAINAHLAGISGNASQWLASLTAAQASADKAMTGTFGTEQSRAASWDSQQHYKNLAQGGGGRQQVDVHIHVEDKPDTLWRIEAHMAKQEARALQRSAS